MQIDNISNSTFDKKLINYLAVLKPAATAILISPTKTSLKDIIRYTVMDLTLKKVLSIEHKNIKPHPNDAYARIRTYLETGENFTSYHKSNYEDCFLSIVDEESYYLLHSYLSIVYEKTPLDNRMKRKVLKENKILNLFSVAFSFDSLGLFRLNANGKKVQREIRRYFVTLEQHLPQIIENSPQQALQIVSFLKGNFFLLKNISDETLEKINTLIRRHQRETNDAYFNLFAAFEFSKIFFNDLSEEIEALLEGIERAHNNRNSNSDYDVDILDF